MNIVCDTNVLVSGILFRGNARCILQLAARGVVTNCISVAILHEVEDVLIRPKFGLDPKRVMSIVDLFRDSFEVVIPSSRITAVRADPDDNRILEAAMTARADFVVSGDKHLLALAEWKGIQVVSPAQFMETVAAQQSTEGDG